MNRRELITYIKNSILICDIVTETSEVYQVMRKRLAEWQASELLGAVNIDGVCVKLDENNEIHLVKYMREDKEVDLGNLIDIIDISAFAGNKSLKHISGKRVKGIGDNAFYNVPLKEIDFPNVKKIGEGCFMSTKLRNVVLNKLKELPTEAFTNTPIETFRGDEVEVVQHLTFSQCRKLKRIVLPKLKLLAMNYAEDKYLETKVELNIPNNFEWIPD